MFEFRSEVQSSKLHIIMKLAIVLSVTMAIQSEILYELLYLAFKLKRKGLHDFSLIKKACKEDRIGCRSFLKLPVAPKRVACM